MPGNAGAPLAAHHPVDGHEALPGNWLGRMPTGAKVFLILSVALLPLAIIAFFATLRTAQDAEQATSGRMRVSATESARKLAIELVGDMTALRVSLDALETDPGDAPSCARAQGVFAPQAATGTRFSIVDAAGRLICGTPLPETAWPERATPSRPVSAMLGKDGLTLAIVSRTGRSRAAAYFPAAVLATVARPSTDEVDYGERLTLRGDTLVLSDLPAGPVLERRASLSMPIGFAGLVLDTQVRSAPITPPVLVALILPIVMWAAAAGIGWFVVDRLLIRSLRQLRARVADFVPGQEIDPGATNALPAQEIRELGETFSAISRTVAAHEAGLAEGLVRQTRLTREVHHRVKNNLQVISSLINFHARAASTPEATQAYASIQRRVDSLAVVHRHHFAELEEHRGLSLRSVIGELASSIRATAPAETRLGIALDVQPYLVTQDVGIAIAFLITEIVELAMTTDPAAQVRISLHGDAAMERPLLRIASPAFVEQDALRALITARYGRLIEGLSRQLRSPLRHDGLAGAFEIAIAITGRD